MDSKEALNQIREFARMGLYRITRHAAQRIEERGATAQDVRRALTFATDCVAADAGCWKVTGPDTESDHLAMVIAIEAQIIVVTILSD